MSDRPERRNELTDLRDELGDQFLRVAREEPRSRIRRRLRYSGITLVCALLIVPAAVGISGAADEPTSTVRALESASSGCPDALRLPGRHDATRAARDLHGFLFPRSAEAGAACRIAPLPPRRVARPGAECVALLTPRARRAELEARRCLRAYAVPAPRPLGAAPRAIPAPPPIPVPPPAGRVVPGERPGVLRTDCLVIRTLGGALEARSCAATPPPPRVPPP